MKREISISIPKPCSKKWSNFDSTATGGFCKSCNKNVIDFTTAGDDEIFLHFKNKPSHACGKFLPSQLKTYRNSKIAQISPGFVLLKAGFMSLLFLLINKPATAQRETSKPKKEIRALDAQNNRNEEPPRAVTVKGIVTATEDGSPLPGVNIIVKGTDTGTSTDAEGRYEIAEIKAGDVLCFFFIGLESRDFTVSRKQIDASPDVAININLALALDVMGEVSVEGAYSSDHGWLKNAWIKFKGIF